MKRQIKGIALGIIGSVSIHTSAIAAEYSRSGELVGTWCDIQPLPSGDYVIEVWRDQNDQLSYHILIRNSGETELGHINYAIEHKNGTWYIQNTHNEYARKGSDGTLKIYDSVGWITTAKPVPAKTHPANCRFPNKKG